MAVPGDAKQSRALLGWQPCSDMTSAWSRDGSLGARSHTPAVSLPTPRQGYDLLNWFEFGSLSEPFFQGQCRSSRKKKKEKREGDPTVSFHSEGVLDLRPEEDGRDLHAQPHWDPELWTRNGSIVQWRVGGRKKREKHGCLTPGGHFFTDTVMCHFEVHNNEQSHSINVLDVCLCLLNQLPRLLFALCLSRASERAAFVRPCVCATAPRFRRRIIFFFCCAALLFCLLWWIWSLMKGNNVPYEGEMCSLIQQIPLAELKGGNLSWGWGGRGGLRVPAVMSRTAE